MYSKISKFSNLEKHCLFSGLKSFPFLKMFPLFRCDANTCTDDYPQILMPENSPLQSNLALIREPAG